MEKIFISELNAINGAVVSFAEKEEELKLQIEKLDGCEENAIELEILKKIKDTNQGIIDFLNQKNALLKQWRNHMKDRSHIKNERRYIKNI